MTNNQPNPNQDSYTTQSPNGSMKFIGGKPNTKQDSELENILIRYGEDRDTENFKFWNEKTITHDTFCRNVYDLEQIAKKEILSLIQTSVQEAYKKAIDDVKIAGYGYDDGTGFILKISFAELNQLKDSSKKELDDSIKSPTGEIYYKQDNGVCKDGNNG